MSSVLTFYSTSVGRKLLVGLTGFFLCAFLAFHLTVNLFLFGRPPGETYNEYSEFLATHPLLRPLEIILFLGFIVHAFIAVVLWLRNRRARPQRYAVNRESEASNLSARLMIVTGTVVLLFLVIHVNTFFVQSRFFAPEHAITMYERVATAFASPWYSGFYVIALVFLAYHLRQGFQSAFQTYGLRVGPYRKLIEAIAVIFWLLIPLAFAALPIYFLWVNYARAH